MDERQKMIDKLDEELKVQFEFCVHNDYSLESPEVQNMPMFRLRLTIGETRIIRDVLRTYHNQRNQPS